MFKKILILVLVSILSFCILIGCKSELLKDEDSAKNIIIESEEIKSIHQDLDSYGCELDIYTDKDTVVIDLSIPKWILDLASCYELKQLSDYVCSKVLTMKQNLERMGNDTSIRFVVKDMHKRKYITIIDGEFR